MATTPWSPEQIRNLENDADLSLTVHYLCAINNEHRFATGVVGESVYSNYYSTAYGAAWMAVAKWILADRQVVGYVGHESWDGAVELAEEILAVQAEVGPEPVRQLMAIAKGR